MPKATPWVPTRCCSMPVGSPFQSTKKKKFTHTHPLGPPTISTLSRITSRSNPVPRSSSTHRGPGSGVVAPPRSPRHRHARPLETHGLRAATGASHDGEQERICFGDDVPVGKAGTGTLNSNANTGGSECWHSGAAPRGVCVHATRQGGPEPKGGADRSRIIVSWAFPSGTGSRTLFFSRRRLPPRCRRGPGKVPLGRS